MSGCSGLLPSSTEASWRPISISRASSMFSTERDSRLMRSSPWGWALWPVTAPSRPPPDEPPPSELSRFITPPWARPRAEASDSAAYRAVVRRRLCREEGAVMGGSSIGIGGVCGRSRIARSRARRFRQRFHGTRLQGGGAGKLARLVGAQTHLLGLGHSSRVGLGVGDVLGAQAADAHGSGRRGGAAPAEQAAHAAQTAGGAVAAGCGRL